MPFVHGFPRVANFPEDRDEVDQNMVICCPLERWYAVPLNNFLAFFPAETFRHVDFQIFCDIVVQFLGLRVSCDALADCVMEKPAREILPRVACANIHAVHVHRENRAPAQALAAVAGGVLLALGLAHGCPFAGVIFAGDMLVAKGARKLFLVLVRKFMRSVRMVSVCPGLVRAHDYAGVVSVSLKHID